MRGPATGVLLGAAASLLVGCGGPARGPELQLNQPASVDPGARMTLPRLGGGQVSLQELRGRPVLLTLFTTWCLRCQAEAPLFVQLHEQHGRRGLRILAVALDVRGRPMVQPYVEFVGFKFDVLLARPDDIELVGGLGVTRQVPRTVLLDARGRIVLDQQGATDFAALRAGVERSLR